MEKRNKGRKGGFGGKKTPNKKKYAANSAPKSASEKEGIRLNKYLANAGLCSRREADTYIESGVVEVNGNIVTQLGYRVQPGDVVKFGEERIGSDRKTYILMNKPKGFTCMAPAKDVQKTVYDLIRSSVSYPMKAISWLDRPDTGVLFLTNDYSLEKKLSNPNSKIKMLYHVVLNKSMTPKDIIALREGIDLEEGLAKLDKVEHVDNGNKNELGIETHLNWDKLIKRIFEKLDYEVISLDRVSYAGFNKKNISRGEYRALSQMEINRLLMLN